MALWIVPPRGIVELGSVPEIFADAIGAIELNGDNVRLYMVADQLPFEDGSAVPQRIVVAKIVRPICNVPNSIGQLALCLHKPPREPFVPRVV